jgi:hypothetical protein
MHPYFENLSVREAIEYLELHMLTYEPEEYVLGQIKTVRDLYEHRIPLKAFVGTDRIVSHIAGIMLAAIDDGVRMRTLDCLKVLRALVKSGQPAALKPDTIAMLFRIYREFIFRDNENVRWCVSVILKGKLLSDAAIDWLVQNSSRSEHLVNRLLLYPEPHPKIRKWAKRIHDEGGLPRRRSEVMALLLTQGSAYHFARNNDLNTFAWAVFKSHLERQQKIALLGKYSAFETFASVIEIADRLESPELLRQVLTKLKKEERGNKSVNRDNQ